MSRPTRRDRPTGCGRLSRLGQGGELGIEALAFGLLIFITGTLIFVNGWAVVDAKLAAAAAAREAARAYVEAPDNAAAAAAAEGAANNSVQGYDRDPAGTTVSIGLERYGRCQRIVAEVHTLAPLLRVPWVGQMGTVTVVARHSELIDPFRSGLPGTSVCA
jgi:hypothetical protein